MERRNSGSLSSLTGMTPPGTPRTPTEGGAKKGAGIQMQIQQLAHEQERVQKKTFTNWMNSYLKQKNMKVENLFEDIKDGVYLLSLLEVLSGEKLKMEKGKLKRVHYVSNISTALSFLEQKKIKLVNINVSDIADGKPSIVLGLIWTIILYFQIEDTFAQAATDESGEQLPLSALEKFRMNAKKALLAWTGNAITKKYGIEIKNFGKSWRDGLAFNAMVHTINPDLVDFDQCRKQNARTNLEQAFSVAESQLGIPRLLDAEDVDVEKPDEKSVMTYVAQFLKAYPEAGEDPSLSKRKNPAEQELADYNDLMTWINEEADEVLQIVDQPVTERQQEYMDYLAFKTEFDRRQKIFQRLEEKVLNKKAVKVTPKMWEELEPKWKDIARRTRMWLWKLDASLPGRLGKFGDWLNQAEEMLEIESEQREDLMEMAEQIVQLLNDHKNFFKELDQNKQFFLQVKRAGKYEGEFIPPPQMDNLHTRLQVICKEAPKREKMLEYDEYRYRLAGFSLATEEKLKMWADKLGTQEEVEEIMMDYMDFVQNNNLFVTYDKTLDETKKKGDAFRKLLSKEDSIKIIQFADEETKKWKSMSAEIKSLQPMFEGGLEHWKRYNSCFDALIAWITEGEQVMHGSKDQIEDYFSEIPQYEEKHKILNDSADFLIENCREPVAEEIKQNLQMLNGRYVELVDGYQHYKKVEVIGKGRQQYQVGVDRISQWLKNAEELLAQEVPCRHALLKEHLQEVDTCGNQVTEMENDFKVTTKTAQSLVKDSEQTLVTEMLQTLNVQKEVIVRLRKEIPERVKYLKAVLPNVESLETGILDLNAWLDKGEALLASHQLDGEQQAAEERLEKHKQFFAETTYQKSIVESKNKVHQKVSSTKPKLKNVNFDEIDVPMEDTNQRFQNCISSAKDWEKKLDNLSRLWRVLSQKEQALANWLQQAETVLNDYEDDTESLIRKHKGFFNKIDKRLLEDYLRAGQDILKVLEDREKTELQQDMASIQERWKNLQALTPIKLVKLEFRLPEETFVEQCNGAEKNLQQEQRQLQKNENVKETLQKHRQVFVQSQFVPTCTKCLESMEGLSKDLKQLDKNDHSLQDRYDDHLDRWRKLNTGMDTIHLQLKQLPERWKEYNQKMSDFRKAVQTVDDLMKALQQEDLTNEEYKDLQMKFQKALRDMNKFADNSKWLEENLEELLSDSPEADAAEERRRLQELLAKFSSLQPNMEKVSDKSAVFSKAYDFRDEIDKRSSWLDEAQRLVNDDPFIDGLEDARAYLLEHENILKRLESEKPKIQADIEAGKRLQKDRNAPTFVSKSVDDLDRKWRDTNEKAAQKHEKLKQKVKEWENYETSKSQCLQLLKKAEAELEKPPATTGQELAEKDLQSKKELQRTLDKLKGSINDMQKLNAVLAESASRERKGPLKVEISEIDKRLDNVSNRLNAKLADLEATIAKWTEYYKRLNNFCEWLNKKETNLNDVYENKSVQPEEQLEKANDISREVYENRVSLENLEKDAKGLSQNFRSRETAALKTKLASVRRQWENLCSRAKDRSSALTGSVAHWQMYQNLSQQLMPWIEKAQKYCATELPKCSSLEEAKDLYNLHQSFVKECEEQFPIFEKLNTEAGYLMDQPNVPSEMEALQSRWNDIIASSEDRSHKVEKMYGAWAAYDQEVNNFDEVLEKLQGRMAEEPNVHSTDVQVLEHELAIGKTLQEEIRSHQPHLRALEKQFEQVKKHASPEGVQALKSKMDAIKSAYDKTTEDAAERQSMVGAAVKHRQDFYGQLQDFEKWLKKSQRKLDTGNEIYADEVPELRGKLKDMKAECESHEPMFNALSQEFKDMIKNCSEEEAALLRDRFDRLMAGYTKVEDLIKSREDLCEEWTNYTGDQKDVQAKLKTLQQKLQAPDISEEEVAKINKEVEALRRSMAPWNRKKEQLDDLMGTAQLVIKDRATQRTLHFGTELQALENMCDSVSTNAKQKEGHLVELSQLWDDFDQKKDHLLDKLQTLSEKIQNSSADSSSLQGIKELVNEVEEARDDMYAMNPEYEQLRELGRQLQQADNIKGGNATGSLRQVNEVWDQVQALLADKHQTYSGVANLWHQYNDNKQNVGRVLEDVDPQVQQEMAFTSPDEVKKALDQHKNAEFELHANQSQLDQMNNKGLQLLEELKNVPNFDVSILERDLDAVNHKWETSNSEIEQHKENLEAQLICWDQVVSGKEEIESWMNTMNTKLADSLTHFDDAVSVESCLMKYKEEAPYYADVIGEVQQKIQDLQELNKGRQIPELTNSQKEIQEKFEKSSTMANQLETIMANFSDERENLQRAIEEETDAINRIKDKLAKCDDVSGTDEDLVKRLQNTKELQKELEAHERNIKALQEKTDALQSKYPSAETSNLAKDAVVLSKKFDTIANRGDKIADMLESTLEQHCQDAQLQEQRWINAAKEKLAWCGDISGDRYSVEGKLATIKDLIAGLKDGEQKKDLAASKLDTLKAVLPKDRQGELEKQRKLADKEFQDLVKQLQQTQNKLEGSVDQWMEYDNKYEGLSQWIKEMEGKVRNEANLKSDLPSKVQQAEHFNDLNEDILRHRPQFEALHSEAQEISDASGDGRTSTYATQLLSRYDTLANNVNEQCDRCDQNVEQHTDYLSKHKNCMDWLDTVLQDLDDCNDLADDQDSLQAKLQTVQEILADKEEGLAKFNAALEAGEKLYPNTSNNGRESVRKDLRALREKWESFNDKLNDTQRALESSRMQWTTFDDNYDQLLKWVADMDNQVQEDEELRNTLQEKKAMLQHCRTRCQDIVSHQTMIDSVGDKGAALSSQQAKGKLNRLNEEYRALCTAAQNQVKSAEDHVEQHQIYHDTHQQCHDWINMTKDKLTVCAEATGDKQALTNRLDRVQDLLSSLRDGEKKVKAAHVQGEKTIPQTARQGQASIHAELETMTQDYETLATKLGDTQQNLTHSIEALQAYDGSCDALNKWLRDIEAQIKEHDMKSTLPEKEAQVEKYKDLLNEVNSRQDQFDDLKSMASQVQGSDSRLISLSSQLSTRYQTAKTNLNDLIGKLRGNVVEHETYQENFNECSEWLGTLLQRLQICADMAGDKHDVEDRLSKLQELVAEKDQGATKIHYTVECGEKLYPSTASEGRDIIRQELRALREQWEQGCDVLSETQRKLDTTLLQWSSYDENFEQFQKWLLDTEIKLREDTDLKATLPDKKAQLQNHRVLHQDIVSRQHVIDNLLDKAKNLSQSSPAAKVAKYVGELQTKYEKLCDTSKQMLDKLDSSVKDHQQYQDMYQDCQDWLNSSREKVELCADTSGDKMSLQSKLERLKECADKIGEGEKKLKATKDLCEKTTKNSSQRGREVLRRDIDHLQSEWEDYLARIQQTEEDLQTALVQWGDFESKFAVCSSWLKDMEQQVKNYELKSTLKEKQAQVERFKKQREEILSHQPEIDRFTDDAQNLMHTSSDARLSTQVSQLTNRYRGLLSQVKDLISKWEKYAQDHQSYQNRLAEFDDWIKQAETKLEVCQQSAADQETMEERRTMIQMLMAEKDHGLQKLNATIEAGEKLYPDTAAGGREKVRQELRTSKDDWDRLFTGLSDTQRKVDSFLMQWSSYADGQDQLIKWMVDTEAALRADVESKNTLQEKRLQLQNLRPVLSDITSHQRLVDSVIEKAQGVLHTTSNPEVAAFITDINSRYEELCQIAKATIQQCEHNVTDHQQYHDSLQAAIDWMTLMKDRVGMCADISGDRHTLQNKFDRVQELLAQIPDNVSKISLVEEKGAKAMETTALKGRQGIQQELDMLKMDWENYTTQVRSLHDNLDRAIEHWIKYEEQHEQISHWVKDMEKKVKDFPQKSTVEEKQQQLVRYQDLMQDLRSHQREIDQFSDDGQTLQQLTGESRVATSISQLVSRYQTLQQTVKENLKKCEQNVADHKLYRDRHTDCSQWLVKARNKFGQSADTSGNRNDLEDRLEKIQELSVERDAGFGKLNNVVESGERLYPNTAAEGREVIRQELRQLKLGWESLFDDLTAAQRKLEVALVQWTSFDDSYGQVEHWLRDMESQLEGQLPLRSTLEEKKTQLQNYKVLHQDVLSYQRVIDSVNDKAQSLVQSSSDPHLTKFVTQARSRYQKLCAAAKERVQQYEVFVADHQQYNDAYNNCIEWLNGIREKLSMCSDVSGDRHTIQNRLDKIQDIVATKMEGEPKVKNVISLAERVLPSTATQGKDIIMRETDALRDDWDAFVNALQKTKTDLENCMGQWKEFDTWQEKVSAWLKDLEAKVRDTELKATLNDKQVQIDRLKAIHRELLDHQGDIDALSDAAQDLVRVSTDTRVISQASQLSTKYQTVYVNVKELCRRWEQYVLDHQAYNDSFNQCKSWIQEMRNKLQARTDVSGDRKAVQERLAEVQELMADKDEGLHMLQISLDNLQIVLPNTSVPGRDNLRREMQGLQAEYDALSGDLNELKTKLDGTLAQWTVYDDSIEQLHRWLNDLELQLQTESQLQNTLQEKKLQFERVKVLQLNINSQQSTIDNLNDKAENLKQTSKDTNLGNQIRQLVTKYEKLLNKVKDLMTVTEKNVKDHQIYRDTFMDCSEWLSSMVDRLNLCSDVRGDRTAIEAQIQKLQELFSNIDQGQDKLQATIGKGEIVLPETSNQGQDLIKEELSMLTTEFEGFVADGDDLKNNLERLIEEWHLYENQYEELSQWIKDTETDMKTESDLKATLEDKTEQLEKQQGTHESILEKQSTFDALAERAQTLLQSTTDNRVTSQLTQLSARYTTLMSASKDLLKRYEQHVLDHEQYAESFTEAATWLQNIRDKLSVCSDTSGDKYTIQSQLEKLQEFVVAKEEGQLMIHSANTWGEKAMTNTSMEGREMIRKELQQLQQEWESLISEITDTKVMLESCLLQWADYNHSYEKIQKWLRDTEKRLRETEPKGDLSEKKAELQRLKSVYQDVISYEQMIESIDNKAQELSSKSPHSKASTDTTQIVSKYQTLRIQAKDMMAKSEQCVASHQAYHDSCNGFISWLRAAREKLATCQDTFGEKTAVVGKIDRLKALQANIGEGSHRLGEATKSGESTLHTTSPSGQTKIRQELQAMKRDFEDYRSVLNEALEDQDTSLTRWNEFEESYNQFNAWLKEAESFLRADLEPKMTLEDKKKQWDYYQNYMDEVLSHQGTMDRVNEKAQALLATNADAKTSHAITQLTTRYQGVVAMSKDIVKNLELYCDNHAGYKQASTDFEEWLADTKHKLRSVHDSSGTKDDVGSKLNQIMELQAAMDQGHNLLRTLLECSERTLPNTSARGCQMIKQDTEKAKTQYENLLTDVSQAKRGLESALSQWGDFDRSYDQLSGWVTDLETKLRSDPEARVDLPEKRSSLEKFKAIQADILGHRDALNKLEDKASNLKDSRPIALVRELNSRYQQLHDSAKDMTLRLDDIVRSHEEYRKAYIGCLDWLANNRHRLQRLSDYTGDRQTLQDRLQQLKDFKGEMRQGQDMVNNATQLGERVCMSTAPRGQEAIHKEIQNLKDDWNTFSSSVNEMEANLERCIGNWMEMDDEYDRFHEWMGKMESNVKDLYANKPDLQQKQKQLNQGEDIFEEILKKKLTLEHVKERSDAVSQRSIDPRVSNNMMMLSTKYHGLMSAAKGMIQRLSDNAKDHKAYNDAFDDAAHWLAAMDERVQDCNDTSGDWNTIQDRMDDIKQITASMDDGLQRVNRVCDLAEKILPNTSSDGKRIIEQQVTELTNEWEKLNQAISECSTMLEGVQERWNDYEEYYGSLVKWLADTEHTFSNEPEPKAQLVEKKTQLDKYKLILSDVENHHRLVNELAERVANLEALSENPDVSDSLADVQTRYDKVRNRAREIVAKLDRAYHDHLDFHEAQQDSEKWLLQTSFKLMSHNALNVSSMEITQRQLDKHRALIREIEDYRITLDMVNKKGRHLAEDNCRVPKMAQQIQSQLRNLEESYLNLQSTAEQIKNRLQDVLQKWQDYKDLLDNDMQFLTGEFTQWLADCDRDVPNNLQDAQRKLDNTKVMWERMSGMRQELTNASHRCENLGGSMENLTQEEAQEESNVNQLAEKVDDKLKESTAELEKRMDSVRDTIHQWELVDRMRGDLRNWLHSKQEDLQEMEEKPDKLHPEAAEIEIANLQALREEVQAKGPAIDSFLNRYRDLTQHDPSLVDPVMRAVREDWEELLGQIENLLEEREQNLQASRELQEAQDGMDDDLENYVKELERIEKEDVSVQEKSLQLKTELRKPCRSTQTPNSSARFGSRRDLLGGSDDSGDDDDGDDSVFKWPHSRHGPSRSHSRQSLNQSRQSLKRAPSGSLPRAFTPTPRSRPRRSHNRSSDDLKKGAAAALESESEESGYGETYYTMHASSFDNVLENETLDTMRGTPLDLEMTRYSDNESTVSYITGEFPHANPEDLRDTMTQTPANARTQTDRDMMNDSPRTIHTQTSGLARNISLQASRMSVASGRSSGSRGSRADLLRSILMDVKEIKQQRGLNDSPGLSDVSMMSNTSVKKDMLQTIQSDVQALKNEGRQGTAGTQTISEQGTQTGLKLFPEGDSVRNSRHGRLRDLMDEVKNIKGNTPDSPNDMRSRHSSRTGTPYERRPMSGTSVPNRASPVRFSTPGPVNGHIQNGIPQQNGYDYPQQPYMRTLPVPPYNPQPQVNGHPPPFPGRMVTQEDINAISDRIQRLQNYQIPPRRTLPQPPPPPPPPQYIVPVYTAPPRRVRINEFPQTYGDEDGFMSDESEYEGGHTPRRGRRRRSRLDHLDIENALDEAVAQGRQLKNMSKKMKDSLRDDLLDL